MQIARKIASFLMPDKVVYVLSEEFSTKKTRYQKHLLRQHGSDLYLAPSAIIFSPGEVSIGKNCMINDYVHILGKGGVTIGDGVWIANHASIISETHPVDVEFIGMHPSELQPVAIADNVWIGSHAVILPGVTLGTSCVVGAGSVVTKDVPPYAVVAGVPAKIMRYKAIGTSVNE